MKYAGKPETAPSWYRDRPQSHIEAEFSKELGDLANAIESEHWFGDKEKHSRYRVDFILKDARLIIELDGHTYHSSPEQLEKDAIRQRYLSRAGYTVIRFTGREINRDPAACVHEVRTIYQERLQRAPAKYRVMYVDYLFLRQETGKLLRFYKKLYPARDFQTPPLEKIIFSSIEWLHEKSFVTVFVFHLPEEGGEIIHLNGLCKEYDKGEIRINTIAEELYSFELGDHMVNYAHLFDEFLVVADDPIYIAPLLDILQMEEIEKIYTSNAKLLRRGNHETTYVGTDLVKVRWQKIWYAIASSVGLSLHEM
jgi:very-short-patch-repair endonuclease